MRLILKHTLALFHTTKNYSIKECNIHSLKKVSTHKIQQQSSSKFKNLFKSLSFEFSNIGQSAYYKPKVSVLQFLNKHQIEFMENNQYYKIKYCPFCPKPHNNDRTNLFVLGVHKQNGIFRCFRCSITGSWLDFQQRVLGITVNSALDFMDSDNINKKNEPSANTKVSQAEYYVYKHNLTQQNYAKVRQYLYSRGFNDQTIQDFNIGAGNERYYIGSTQTNDVMSVYFPLYRAVIKNSDKQKYVQSVNQAKNNENFKYNNNWTEIIKMKCRGASKQDKMFMKQYPQGAQRGFFGFNLVKDSDQTIIITEGEFDAMAVYQQTGQACISLPQGASHIPQVLIPSLDRFSKIVLWMDNDEVGKANREKIAYKLGLNRTHLVSHNVAGMKDANDFLKSSPRMINELIQNAKTIPDENIINFKTLKESIRSRVFRQKQNQGIEISWFNFFNRKVKGIRMGELTIISGPTGSGKTTLLSQISLDICRQGIPVLWGSFQIRNQILLTHMIVQYSGINLFKKSQKFEQNAYGFGNLPLYLMNFYGSQDIDKVLSTIIYSIERYNISMIVIDTLQFLLSGQGDGFKRFQIQDTLMASLRKITIDYNVHIIIVIHPRKTDESEDIGIHSIYGTSKATQQADNIWVVQNRLGFKLFDIKKNRYDGEIGKTPIGFNKQNKQFIELKKNEFQNLRAGQKTIEQIILDRQTNSNLKPQQNSIFDNQDEIDESEISKKTQSQNFKRQNM